MLDLGALHSLLHELNLPHDDDTLRRGEPAPGVPQPFKDRTIAQTVVLRRHLSMFCQLKQDACIPRPDATAIKAELEDLLRAANKLHGKLEAMSDDAWRALIAARVHLLRKSPPATPPFTPWEGVRPLAVLAAEAREWVRPGKPGRVPNRALHALIEVDPIVRTA